MDQHNAFRETIADGGAVYGARAITLDPNVVEVYGQLGLDFVWLDFEHTGPSPYDSTVFENLTRAAEAGGTELLVRLPSGDPPLVRKVLDAGVRNVLVPRVDSAAEVRRAVEAAHFRYDGGPGERGKASSRSSEWGGAENYVEREDDAVCIGAMIEKTTAVADLEDILAVPDLGFVFVGPSDLSAQMGHPTNKTHPEVQEQIAAIRDAALSAGVPLGAIRNDPDEAAAAVEAGYQVLRIGGDLEAVRTLLGDRLARLRE